MKPLIILFFSLIFTTGCSQFKASPADSSPFLENESLLKPAPQRISWDGVWSADPDHIAVKAADIRTIYIAPINTDYLNMKKDKTGKYVKARSLSDEDVKAITDLIETSFVNSIQKVPAANLKIVDNLSDAHLKLELALVELIPTTVAANIAADVGGFIIPGSKAIEKAAETGAQAAGGALASGSIAIEMKLSDPESGKLLAEAKDRESDPASLILNYRDFEQFAWSRHTVKDWSDEFAQIFSTPATTKVDGVSHFSFIPW